MNNRRPTQDRPNGNGRNNRRRRRPTDPQSRGQRPERERGPRSERPNERPEPTVEAARKSPPVLRHYGVVFYDNFAGAREDKARLDDLKKSCDQLNIVIKAEGSMDDPELLAFGKVYAGEAWYLIHKRRESDGWYLEPHE